MITARKKKTIKSLYVLLCCSAILERKITMIRSKVVEQYLTIFTHEKGKKNQEAYIIDWWKHSIFREKEINKSAEKNIIRVFAFNVSCLQSGKLENFFPQRSKSMLKKRWLRKRELCTKHLIVLLHLHFYNWHYTYSDRS